MKKPTMEDIEGAKESILRAVQEDTPYSHNICSVVLRVVWQKFGIKYANSLITECGLDSKYGFQKLKYRKEARS